MSWDPAKHPRLPSGTHGGGQFKTIGEAIDRALMLHGEDRGHPRPLKGIERRHLLEAAERHGVRIHRDAQDHQIAQALLDDARAKGAQENQSRVSDPHGMAGLLTIRAPRDRGDDGNGRFVRPDGTPGPWGKYGASGVMLRHVGSDGQTRYLMIQRGSRISDPGKWQFPGGARDSRENDYEAAARETVEELGLSPRDLATARVHGFHKRIIRGGWSYTSIAATVPTQLKPNLSSEEARLETADAKWMTRAEIEELDRRGELLASLANGRIKDNVMSLFPPSRRATRSAVATLEKALWDPSKHPRLPAHSPGGGRFRSIGAAIDHALTLHGRGEGHPEPLHGVERRHLLDAAKRHGVSVAPRTSDEHVARALLNDAKAKAGGGPSAKPKTHLDHLDDAKQAIASGRHADAVNHLMAAENAAPDKATRDVIAAQRRSLAARLMHGAAPTTATPKPRARAARAPKVIETPHQTVARLNQAKTVDEAHAMLAGKTIAELRDVAAAHGAIPLPSRLKKKDDIARHIAEQSAGRRLAAATSAAQAAAAVRKPSPLTPIFTPEESALALFVGGRRTHPDEFAPGVLDRLVSDGLVNRLVSPSSGVHLSITPQGQSRLDALSRRTPHPDLLTPNDPGLLAQRAHEHDLHALADEVRHDRGTTHPSLVYSLDSAKKSGDSTRIHHLHSAIREAERINDRKLSNELRQFQARELLWDENRFRQQVTPPATPPVVPSVKPATKPVSQLSRGDRVRYGITTGRVIRPERKYGQDGFRVEDDAGAVRWVPTTSIKHDPLPSAPAPAAPKPSAGITSYQHGLALESEAMRTPKGSEAEQHLSQTASDLKSGKITPDEALTRLRTQANAATDPHDRASLTTAADGMVRDMGRGVAAPVPTQVASALASSNRQAAIDRGRAKANAAAELHERIANGQDEAVIRRAVNRHVSQGAITPGEADRILAAYQGGNHQAVRDAVDAFAHSHGLTRTGAHAGEKTRFDRRLHKPIGGSIRDGAPVEVVRPGYQMSHNGETIPLDKAVVEE